MEDYKEKFFLATEQDVEKSNDSDFVIIYLIY